MKKSNLFKSLKEVKKTVKDDALSVGAALIGGILGDVVYTKGKEQLPENYKKYTGVGVGVAGGALAVFSKNPMIKAGAHGMVGSAGTNILNDLAPDMSAKIGLSGLADTPVNTSFENQGLTEIEKMMLEALEAEKSGITETQIPGVQD
jgi:hypothetical protein